MSVRCNTCGAENNEESNFCNNCGLTLFIDDSDDVLKPGTILEKRYKVVNLLTCGGMGAVYKIMDNNLDRTCALKELMPNFETPDEQSQAEAWFKREADILSKLDHTNLPSVYDYFVHNGKYYLVMTFVDGTDLETILEKEGKPGIDEDKVIDWSRQILNVLDYLHTRKPPIVYRDIKPSNIMLRPDGRAMLIDFGIARVVKQNSVTQKTAIGTGGYAPVEQYEGLPEPRSDLYALGATMHHLLTGKTPIPFRFETVRKLAPSVSPELEAIIMKALEMKKENRYNDAKEMLEALSFKEIKSRTDGFGGFKVEQIISTPPSSHIKSPVQEPALAQKSPSSIIKIETPVDEPEVDETPEKILFQDNKIIISTTRVVIKNKHYSISDISFAEAKTNDKFKLYGYLSIIPILIGLIIVIYTTFHNPGNVIKVLILIFEIIFFALFFMFMKKGNENILELRLSGGSSLKVETELTRKKTKDLADLINNTVKTLA